MTLEAAKLNMLRYTPDTIYCNYGYRMTREVFTRLLRMVVGILAFCVAIGIARTLRELAFPTYSGFRFYQPLFAIPLHVAVSFVGMGVAQFAAWVSSVVAIRSWSGDVLIGAGYSAATLAAFLAEKHLPQSFGPPGSTHMLLALSALAFVLCIAVRLAFSVLPLRRHS